MSIGILRLWSPPQRSPPQQHQISLSRSLGMPLCWRWPPYSSTAWLPITRWSCPPMWAREVLQRGWDWPRALHMHEPDTATWNGVIGGTTRTADCYLSSGKKLAVPITGCDVCGHSGPDHMGGDQTEAGLTTMMCQAMQGIKTWRLATREIRGYTRSWDTSESSLESSRSVSCSWREVPTLGQNSSAVCTGDGWPIQLRPATKLAASKPEGPFTPADALRFPAHWGLLRPVAPWTGYRRWCCLLQRCDGCHGILQHS
jgi:hypothetical protein